MTQTLSREQIEERKRQAELGLAEHKQYEDHVNAELRLTSKGFIKHFEKEIALCTMALSSLDAYERGQRDMAAAAVKVLVSRKDTTITDEMDDWDKGYEVSLDQAIDALRALSPGEWVAVPADKTLAAEWLRQHWNTFCDCDPIPMGRDRFLKELEDAGLVELREVVDEDLDEAFAFERGIEKGGNIWVLTASGRALIAAAQE